MRPLAVNTPVYILPRFDFETTLRLTQQYRITSLFVVPPILLAFAKAPLVDKYDISSLAGMCSAAAPLPASLIDDVYARLRVPVKQAYGISECAPAITMQRWAALETARGSAGVLLPNITAKWVGLDGCEVPRGEEGELWVKGPNVFMGYHNNAAATQSAFSKDGFYKTGDVGYEDASGNFYITDRVKELIKYKGLQVAPAQLEALMLKHPKVADVAIMGVYDASIASEVPKAFVVAAAGAVPGAELGKELTSWVSDRVSNYKRLRGGIQFVDEVPKSVTGKILRRVLKEKFGGKIMPTKETAKF